MTALTDRLDEWAALAEKATPGPWGWFGNTEVRSVYLATKHSGRRFVMRFVRWGMNGAQPEFQPLVGGLDMVKASEVPVYEVAPEATDASDPRVYRQDVVGLRHPDAAFIAASRTALPAAIEALRAVLAMHTPLRVPTSGSSIPGAPITYALRCSCQPAWRGYPCTVVSSIAAALDVTP